MAQVRRRRRRQPQRKQTNWGKFIAVFAVLGLLAVGAVGSTKLIMSDLSTSIYDKSDEKILKYIEKQTEKQVYFDNIYVDGIAIGGMTREDADNKLNLNIKMPQNKNAITIKSDNDSYTKTFTLDDFGIYYDLEGAVALAYSYGRTGDESQKLADFKMLKDSNKDFKVMYYDEAKIKSAIDDVANAINVSAVDSAVKKTSSGFEVTPSVTGYSMDGESLYDAVLNEIVNRNFDTTVSFTIIQTNPKYTEEDFKYIDNEIGSCYSKYKGGDSNRIANLKNGCLKIDGTVLYPDEIFSTNAHFNPCTYENGWRNAGTIVNGKIEDSIGGGMCQVSSALYQAVLEAELEVVERFNHSLKVGYADYAYDATLAGDYKDLKFKNNTGYPMYLESYTTNSNVVVKIYGYEKHDPTRKLEFKNKLIKTTDPGEPRIIEDNTKPIGYEQTTLTALSGKTYELYKYVYENGSLIDTVKVNTSTYLPRRAEITKGTKEPEITTKTDNNGNDSENNTDGSTNNNSDNISTPTYGNGNDTANEDVIMDVVVSE